MSYNLAAVPACGAPQPPPFFTPGFSLADDVDYSVPPVRAAVGDDTFPVPSARSVIGSVSRREGLVLSGALSQYSPHASPRWSLLQPLPVVLELDEDGTFIVSDDEFLTYGAGPDLPAALDDYISALLDYFDLVTHSDHPYDADEAARLRDYLAARDAA